MPVDETPQRIQSQFGRGMMLAAWLSIMGLLYMVFHYWEDGRLNPNKNLKSTLTSDGRVEVVLRRNAHNHYVTAGKINGRPVVFLLDTGATNVVIPQHLAARLGLKAGSRQRAQTANGVIMVRGTSIHRLSIGALELANIDASLNPAMVGEEILLGMSVLGEVELLQKEGRMHIRAGF